MQIRPLTPADAPAYRALMLQAYAHEGAAFTSTVEERAAAPMSWWEHRACDPQGMSLAFGAFDDDGTLAGSVAIEFEKRAKSRHKALLVGMYVAPSLRGRGAGRALLQVVLAHAREREGLRVVQLTVTEGNDAAVQLYRAAGFEVFGAEPMAICSEGRLHTKLHMQLVIVPGEAADVPLSRALAGTWELLSRIDVDAAGRRRPEPSLGEDPVALIVYDRGGRFAAQFMKRDRSAVADGPAGSANNSRAQGGYDAYFGRYTVDDARGTVTQTLDGALSAENVGLVLTRQMQVEGDRLVIRLDTTAADGAAVQRTLTWKRVA